MLLCADAEAASAALASGAGVPVVRDQAAAGRGARPGAGDPDVRRAA
jgi:hypothetical protein